MKNVFFYQTEIGVIGIAENGEAITNVFFEKDKRIENSIKQETQLLKEAGRQLMEYFQGNKKKFDLPLRPEGTEFQKAVWKALQTIPYGETSSYKQVAEKIGNPKACRAVGMANNRNPIAIIIPCHRVIGSSGKLVGYAGGLDVKDQLLKLEKAHANC
jgi:methylated-DNA-[protein]-cysteine S-methyltransferase